MQGAGSGGASSRKSRGTRSKRNSLYMLQEVLEIKVQPDRLNGLPMELLLAIFECFDAHTLLMCTGVCKTWFELGTDPYFSKRLRVQRISMERFPPLSSWNPLEFYNLFSLASQKRSKELVNYEFFNCSKYCDMISDTEIGCKVKKLSLEAKSTFTKAKTLSMEAKRNFTQKWEGKMQDRMKSIRMNDNVTKVSAGVRQMKDIYKEKMRKMKQNFKGLVEDAKVRSKSINTKIKEKIRRAKNRFKEFYHERTVGVAQSYHCIGHQMRNFVLSSVLLQHVAFSTLLWRHWNKADVSTKPWEHQAGLLALVAIYWTLALISMITKKAPQWLLYMFMSLVLVHFAPSQIVAFDFALLLLTIALATVSVFDIFHRLYKHFLVVERSVLQSHMFMVMQATILFIHLFSPSLVVLTTVMAWTSTLPDFLLLYRMRYASNVFRTSWNLVKLQCHQWIGFFCANMAWIVVVSWMAKFPFSLLHGHLERSEFSLTLLATELTILQCCIITKYLVRYPSLNAETQDQEDIHRIVAGPGGSLRHQRQIQLHQEAAHRNAHGIPPPPPIPARWILENQRRQRQLLQPQKSEEPTSMALLHPTVYWHYVWILGVICDFLMGLLDRFGYSALAQSLSLVLPVVALVAVLPVQIHYWNNKYNYDLDEPCQEAASHVH